MVTFACPSCGRWFSVPDKFVGRSSRCACGQTLVVPAESTAALSPPPPQAAPMSGLRQRRLAADEAELRASFANPDGVIALESAEGAPAERYVLAMRVRSLAAPERPAETHRVEVQLTHDYPRVGPKCRMLTPVFHPNVDATSICIGDHWTAGERLVDLVVRIAEMLAYQAYNIRSPLNAEAAMWADLNAAKLPTDPRDMRAASIGGLRLSCVSSHGSLTRYLWPGRGLAGRDSPEAARKRSRNVSLWDIRGAAVLDRRVGFGRCDCRIPIPRQSHGTSVRRPAG